MAELLARCWCVVCDAPVLAAPSQWERVKCSGCGRAAFGASSEARAPWQPTIARVAPAPSRPAAAIEVPAAASRVLVPARPATPAEIPSAARRMADVIAAAPDRLTRVTYALGEEPGGGRLIHSCALRVYNTAGAALGYALWIDSAAARATWWSPLRPRCAHAEFLALATSQLYEPPSRAVAAPVGDFLCTRCGSIVPSRIDGTPRKHQRATRGGEGGAKSAREVCA